MKDIEECNESNKMSELPKLIIGDKELDIPVVQGGMGVGVSLSGLAGAVAKEGGIGIISTAQIGFMEEDFEKAPLESCLRAIEKHIAKAKEIACGKGLVGVNVMHALKHYKEHVTQAVKCGADIIVCGAGLPIDLPVIVEEASKKYNVKKPFLAPIVSSARAAGLILKNWAKNKVTPDMIVVEGPKAGGHLGYKKEELDELDSIDFDEIVKGVIEVRKEYEESFNVNIPVVAGGGIMEKEDVYHLAKLGVSGFQIASRLVATFECDASDRYKQAYVNAREEDIEIIKSPVGLPGRAIRNNLVEKIKTDKIPVTKCLSCLSKCKPAEVPFCITKALIDAVKGDTDNGLVFCGAEVYKINKITSVHDALAELGFAV